MLCVRYKVCVHIYDRMGRFGDKIKKHFINA